MKGKIISKRKDNTAIKIEQNGEEKWINVTDDVVKYVENLKRDDEIEFTIINDKVAFIKIMKPIEQTKTNNNYWEKRLIFDKEKQDTIMNEALINSSIEILKLSVETEKKVDDILEIVGYVSKKLKGIVGGRLK